MFDYDPAAVLPLVTAPIIAIRRSGSAPPSLAGVALTAHDLPAPGHNLLRYRPAEVTAAILGR
jgi:hypothetical protein